MKDFFNDIAKKVPSKGSMIEKIKEHPKLNPLLTKLGIVDKLEKWKFADAMAIALTYLALYTTYDAATNTINPHYIIDLFTGSRGRTWTILEANRVICHAGMTTMFVSYLSLFKGHRKGLLNISLAMLMTHSALSMFHFFGFNPKRVIKDKTTRKIGILLGSACEGALTAGVLGYLPQDVMVYSTIGLGLSHFYFMEIGNKNGSLKTRPMCYIHFPIALWAILERRYGAVDNK